MVEVGRTNDGKLIGLPGLPEHGCGCEMHRLLELEERNARDARLLAEVQKQMGQR